ncbi:MAG: hypothetical protein WEE69_14715, partial [Acidimicrobiia bacterium]
MGLRWDKLRGDARRADGHNRTARSVVGVASVAVVLALTAGPVVQFAGADDPGTTPSSEQPQAEPSLPDGSQPDSTQPDTTQPDTSEPDT